MTPFEQAKQALIWQPLIAGLEVQEPETTLEVNLGWHAWDRAVSAMDDMAAFATQHMELCK